MSLGRRQEGGEKEKEAEPYKRREKQHKKRPSYVCVFKREGMI